MQDISHDREIEFTKMSHDLIGIVEPRNDHRSVSSNLLEPHDEKVEALLPSLLLNVDNQRIANESKAGKSSESAAGKTADSPAQKLNSFTNYLIPEETKVTPQGEAITLQDPELNSPIDSRTLHALMKDAGEHPPVHNPDGSTTYTIVQAGLTDRPGKREGVDYYSRAVNVTVPKDNSSLNDCKFIFNPREIVTKDQYEKLIENDKTANENIEFFAHGVSTSDVSSDRQALMLQLSNGRPTVNLDWNANPIGGKNPKDSLNGYDQDTISAKRANDNMQFASAIDDTIKQIGAEHTSLIGFSHGGFFDTRYLDHRVAAGLPQLDTVILTHPDVPVGAPELRVSGKAELLKDSAKHSYVIGGTSDLAMKMAVVASYLSPGTPTYENGNLEDRLGNNSDATRHLISAEGAIPITEYDRENLTTEHFLNCAGIRSILDGGSSSAGQTQETYDSATRIGRSSQSLSGSILTRDLVGAAADFTAIAGSCGKIGSDLVHTRFSQVPQDVFVLNDLNFKTGEDVLSLAGAAIEKGAGAALVAGGNFAKKVVRNLNPLKW
jgi:hypothetical protein